MKKFLKLCATDFKRVNLYGDGMAIDEFTTQYAFRGQSIRIKFLGLFWVTYIYYTIN